MGCTCSSDNQQHNQPQPIGSNEIALGSSKPFIRNKPQKSTGPEETRREFLKRREVFWDTAPKYEGRMEIWLALKAACEAEDDGMARVMLDSAGIIIPTGFLSDGCFDELGNRYVIPEFCIVEPSNLITGGENDDDDDRKTQVNNDDSTPAKSDLPDEGGDADDAQVVSGPSSSIALRLSSGEDITVSVPDDCTIETVEKALLASKTDLASSRLRFMYMGKTLAQSSPAGRYAADKLKIQVMITPLK